MVSEKKLHIVPRRGEYCLLDKEAGNHVSATVFQLPGKYGKGILVSPTIHGKLLVGPTAVDQEDKDGTYTTAEGLAEACEKAAKSVNNIPFRQVITSFSGLRARETAISSSVRRRTHRASLMQPESSLRDFPAHRRSVNIWLG